MPGINSATRQECYKDVAFTNLKDGISRLPRSPRYARDDAELLLSGWQWDWPKILGFQGLFENPCLRT